MDKWAAERKLGVSEEHQRIERLWEKHNRFGGGPITGGHAMGAILPPQEYGPSHPEYYALINGERRWRHFDGKHCAQPCTTNPDVIRIVISYARKFFDQHPDYEAFSISLNDGGGFCECDRCRRLDSGRTEVLSSDAELKGGKGIVITDRVVTFVRQTRWRRESRRRTPGKKLISSAYGPYREPPVHVRVAPNLIIQYTFHASSNWDPEGASSEIPGDRSVERRRQAPGDLRIPHTGELTDLPRLMPEPIARSVLQLYKQGYRAIRN